MHSKPKEKGKLYAKNAFWGKITKKQDAILSWRCASKEGLMSEFKTPEEYEKWKAERLNDSKEKPATKTQTNGQKKCPYCAEDIQESAIKCRYCGSMLDGSQQETNIKINEIDPLAVYKADIKKKPGKLSVLGYIGIVLGLLIFFVGIAQVVGFNQRYIDKPTLIDVIETESRQSEGLMMTALGVLLVLGCYLSARRKP